MVRNDGEARNERPIRLGIVELISMDGDTVGRAFSGDDGRFAVRAEEPGVFTLSASAYGYRTTVARGFELGRSGAMTVEVRMTADPVELDEMVVGFNRPMLDHPLVSNGFVERFRQGFGHFITPVDLERSPASVTTDLFRGLTGVTLRPPDPGRDNLGSGSMLSYAGDQIMLQGQSRWCPPTIYLDGVRLDYDGGTSIDALVPIGSISAVEIYRRATEVPVQYNATRSEDLCGVILFWTKQR